MGSTLLSYTIKDPPEKPNNKYAYLAAKWRFYNYVAESMDKVVGISKFGQKKVEMLEKELSISLEKLRRQF